VNVRCKIIPEPGSRIGSCDVPILKHRPNLKKEEAEVYEAYRKNGFKTSVVWTDGTTSVITYCWTKTAFGLRRHLPASKVEQEDKGSNHGSAG